MGIDRSSRTTSAMADDLTAGPTTTGAWWVILIALALALGSAWIPPGSRPGRHEFVRWWNGSAQEEIEYRMATTSLLARWTVPVRNHMDLHVFHRINLAGHFIGREETLFATVDVASFQGSDALPIGSVLEQVHKAVVVRDSLQRRGIQLVFVLAPGKASTMPERLPPAIKAAEPGTTNYERFAAALDSAGLPLVDMERWFQELKNTAPYPLYPRYGSHWSSYAECLALDSIIRYVEGRLPHPLPHLTWSTVELDRTARMRDADVASKAGVWRLSHQDTLAYPAVGFTAPPHARAVRGMVIGDSYARGFRTLGVMDTVFVGGPYWYYYNSREPGDRSTPEIWELDLEQEILQHKVIILLANPANLSSLGNGFIDDAYDLFTDRVHFLKDRQARHVFRSSRKAVRNDPALMRILHARSRTESIPLDTLVDQEARARSNQGPPRGLDP